MTYDARERSEEDAAPIELYEFRVYDSLYLFTTAATEQTVALRTYAPQPMQRSKPESTTEIPRQNITVRTRPDHPMTQFYEGNPPSTVVLLRIQRYHRGDADPNPFWSGRVLNCDWQQNEAVFYCESIYTSLRRTGLRRLYGRNCPYEHYGRECKALEAAFRSEATLTAVDGIALSAAAFDAEDDGRFIGGFISWEPIAGEVIRRAIIGHTGDTVQVTHPVPGLEAGQVVLAHPGCARNIADCNDFYDNIENYGGLAPFMQKINPFGGGNVF